MVEFEIVEQGKHGKTSTTNSAWYKMPFFRRNTISDDNGRLDAQWLDVNDANYLICLVRFNLGIGTTIRIKAKGDLIVVPLLLTGHLHVENLGSTPEIFPLQYYLLTIGSGTIFKIRNDSREGCLLLLVFQPEYFEVMRDHYDAAKKILEGTYRPKKRFPFLTMDAPLQQIVKYILASITDNRRLDIFRLSVSVQSVMAMVAGETDKSFEESNEYSTYHEWQLKNVEKVKHYLKENPDEFAGMEALAKMAEMNPNTFRTVFDGIVGCKPYEYWNYNRMELARSWLIHRKFKPLQVAKKLGFASSQSFNKQFKKIFFVSPSHIYKNSL